MAEEKTSKGSSAKKRAQDRGEAKVSGGKDAAKGINTSPHDVTELQDRVDEIQEKGYFGETPDPTPNEHYTVAGVTAGKPTPETDADLFDEARVAAVGNPHRNIELPSHLTAKGEESDRSEFNKGGKTPAAFRGEEG